ncbi:LCP family protein [Candidatus Saccharibacteria bacterium]|nr:LCP family protein [Candidatus Saccharibacteria bacterium]
MSKKDKRDGGMIDSIKKWPLIGKVAAVAAVVICIVALGIILRYTAAFNGFLDRITNWGRETKEYSVLVKDSSEINDLRGIENQSVGFLKIDPNVATAEQYLQRQVKIESDFYDDIDTLTVVLNNGIVTAIVMENDRLEILKEDATDLVKEMRVIDTFKIEIESDTTEVTEKEITEEPSVVYISGSDSRAGVRAMARSDVNIVAVVNPKAGKILLVSIPRDTYVQLHGTTGLKDKLTHAGVYGIDMSKNTIEDFLGIKIDNTLKVSFETVVKVVDQLDGIEIDSDQEMHLKAEGKDKRCDFVVGKQKVDGDCALRFARERKSYETGDRHRGENQQQVITSIIGKLGSSKNYLLKIPTILDIAADSFETDLSREAIMAFIRMQLGQKIDWQVESIAVNGAGTYEPTYSMGANLPLYVMIPAEDTVINATNKINEYLAQ